jgi:hypothetical protein
MTLNLTIINLLRRFKMRKYLLSTSALAGAALLSSAAVADVSISGNFEFDYAAKDSNIAANDGTLMGHDQEVNIAFTNKTDSGLTITAQNQFKTSNGGQDDVSVSISGGFGKITMGKTDGANGNYEMNALGLVQEEDGGELNNNAVNTTATILTSTGGAGGQNLQASYHLPAMGGLTAGISVGSGAAVTKNDEWAAFGFHYSMDAGGAAVKVGYSSKTTETAAGTADNDLTSMGMEIASGAMKVAVSQANSQGADEDIIATSAGISYDLGNGLIVSAGVTSSEDDLDAGEEYDLATYEAAYTIASGLSAVLNVSDFDYENGTNVDSGKSYVDMNGTTTSLTIKATF